jgi:hypothetical protein
MSKGVKERPSSLMALVMMTIDHPLKRRDFI